MRLPSFLASLLFATLAIAQPNVLLVIADDLGLDPTPNYLPGPQKANMPNLEALMADGLTFDNAWADPLCSPTRSTMLTGRYGFRTGVLNANALSQLPPNEITLHRYLTNSGSPYATSIIGKWHLNGQLPNPAYPNFMGIPYYAGLIAGAVSDYYAWNLTVNGVQTPSTAYITTTITDMAIDWIEQQDAPWFCWLAYTAPHTPFHLPPLNMHTQGALPTDQASIDADPLPYYLAMVESLDYEMGRLLGTLSAEELANTVIIFIGDNGTDRNVIQAPYGMMQSKGTLFEGGVHVPLVIAGPGVSRAGQREGALVNSSDLFTTIVELTGEVLPTYEDSRSLVPMLTQPDLSVHECLYADVEDQTVGHASRDAQYKLISFGDGTRRFYDLLTDPYEQSNLLPGGLNAPQQTAYDRLLTGCELFAGINESSAATLSIHPNPAAKQLYLGTNDAAVVPYGIHSSTGALVLSGLSNGAQPIELQGLEPGLYTIQVGERFGRFVKE